MKEFSIKIKNNQPENLQNLSRFTRRFSVIQRILHDHGLFTKKALDREHAEMWPQLKRKYVHYIYNKNEVIGWLEN